MDKKLEKKVRFLTAYAIMSTLLFGALFLYSFRSTNEKSFDEINVKRINVLAEDGSLRLVISNERRQHPGRINGKDLAARKRSAGILFFNEEGDECGGIMHWGKASGDTARSGMSFTMDQYHNDQVVQIINAEYHNKGKANIIRGIALNNIPLDANLGETMRKYRILLKISDSAERNRKMDELLEKEGAKNRLFIGENKNEQYGLFLCDKKGRLRFRLYIDSLGNARMQTLDTSGNSRDLVYQK